MVSRFVASKGYHFVEHEENDVRYLRFEGDGIEQLGIELVADLYRLGRSASLDLVTEGFAWKP